MKPIGNKQISKTVTIAFAAVITTSVGMVSAQTSSEPITPNSNQLFPNAPPHPSQGGVGVTAQPPSRVQLFDNLADDDPNKTSGGNAISANYVAGTDADDGPVNAGIAADPQISGITLVPGQVIGDIAAIRAALQGPPDAIGIHTAATARVLVTLRPPIGTNMLDQRARVARAPEVQSAIAGTGSAVTTVGTSLGFMVVDVTSAGLNALLQTDAVGALELDRAWPLNLESSQPVTGTDVMRNQGLRGDGDGGNDPWEVVIIDTGVRSTHEKFGGKIVDEACYTTDANCPNGSNTMTGAGAGVPCNDGSYCFHGTHVAGIAAAGFVNSARSPGYAAGANIVAIQAFNADTFTYTSSINSSLDFALTRRNNGGRVASVNLSLGGGQYFSQCNAASPSTTAAVNALRAAGVLVVASTGNDGYKTSMGWPACITGMFSVGNTMDNDNVSSSSNAATFMDMWAPGTSITSATYTGDTSYVTATGTSMSAPAIAGAAAALYDCRDWTDASNNGAPLAVYDDTVAAVMKADGVNVTDNRPGGSVTKRRLDVLRAAETWNANNMFAGKEVLSGATGNTLDYNACGTEEIGEQTPGAASTWHEWTAPAIGVVEFTTCDAYTNFDTRISLYKGEGILALQQIAQDDDDFSCTHSIYHSRLAIPVQAGESVKIAVTGWSAGVQGKYRLNWDFEPGTISPPPATTLLSPINNVNVANLSPTYRWRDVGSEFYRLYVVDDGPATPVVIDNWYSDAQASCNGTFCYARPATQLTPGVTIDWDVQTWNTSGGYGPWAGIENFTVTGSPPAVPVPFSPIAITVSDNTPTYYWTARSGASRYRILMHDSTGTAIGNIGISAATAHCDAGIGRCAYTVNLPHPNGAVTWRVRATNTSGASPWSAPLVYTMDSTLSTVGRGMTISPLPGYSLLSNPPEYKWNAHAGATLYRLYVKDTTGTVVHNQNYTPAQAGCTTTCSVTPNVPLTSGSNARWHSRVYRPAGGWGAFSPPSIFNVP